MFREAASRTSLLPSTFLPHHCTGVSAPAVVAQSEVVQSLQSMSRMWDRGGAGGTGQIPVLPAPQSSAVQSSPGQGRADCQTGECPGVVRRLGADSDTTARPTSVVTARSVAS